MVFKWTVEITKVFDEQDTHKNTNSSVKNSKKDVSFTDNPVRKKIPFHLNPIMCAVGSLLSLITKDDKCL